MADRYYFEDEEPETGTIDPRWADWNWNVPGASPLDTEA